MLITKNVQIRLSSNIKYYLSRGYKGNHNDIIEVKAEDLSKGARNLVEVECEYCGRRKYKPFGDYNNIMNKSLVKKYACNNKECHNQKIRDCNMVKYNMPYPMGTQEYRDKMIKSTRTKYNDVVELFKTKDCSLITTEEEYYNLPAKEDLRLDFTCNKHPEEGVQNIILWNFKAQNNSCKQCQKIAISEWTKLDFEYVKQVFKDNDLILLETEYISTITPMRFICNKHKEKGEQIKIFDSILDGYTCHYCSNERRRGENHYRYYGRENIIETYIRNLLVEWKKKSMLNCNYKCVITGNRFNDIHHLYSFKNILLESLKNLNLPYYVYYNKYTNDQLLEILKECDLLHNKYGLGVCLHREVHSLFHKLYGRHNNTSEQFEEFKIRYKFGEFDRLVL